MDYCRKTVILLKMKTKVMYSRKIPRPPLVNILGYLWPEDRFCPREGVIHDSAKLDSVPDFAKGPLPNAYHPLKVSVIKDHRHKNKIICKFLHDLADYW